MGVEDIEFELIDAYLNGDLTGDRLISFEEKLSSDPNFAKNVNDQQVFNQSLEDYELARFHRKLNQYNPYRSGVVKSGYSYLKNIGFLAAFAIVSASGFLYFSNDQELKEEIVTTSESLERVESLSATKINKTTKNEKTIDTTPINKVKVDKEIKPEVVVSNKVNLIEEENNDTPVRSDEPSYLVVEREIIEEDVLVIKSDYKQKMNYTKEVDDCANLTFNAKIEVMADCEKGNGFIKIVNPTIEGGVKPFTYSINGGDFNSSLIFDQLNFGSYKLKVKDSNGCEIEYHNNILIQTSSCD